MADCDKQKMADDRAMRTQIFAPLEESPAADAGKRADVTHTLQISRREIFTGPAVTHRACLEVTGLPSGRALQVELAEQQFIIGRSEECDLHLPFDNVSRNHARIRLVGDEYHLEDLGSTNGSFVNGVPVSKCVLRDNDAVEIGEVKIFFVEERVRE